MAIVNRDLDSSEQKDSYVASFPNAVGTGLTTGILPVPFPMELKHVRVAVQGLSGTPVWSLEVLRWGAGITAILGLAPTLTVLAIGNSQATQNFSLVAAGNTLIQLQAGDLLCIRTGGTNAAVASAAVTVVAQALQDIKTYFGS